MKNVLGEENLLQAAGNWLHEGTQVGEEEKLASWVMEMQH